MNKKKYFITLAKHFFTGSVFLLLGAVVYAQPLLVNELTCEYTTNPVGINCLKPRLSWKLKTNQKGILQTAYRIRVASSISGLAKGEGIEWDTKNVISGQSAYVAYNGKELKSKQRYFWQVKVWDNRGNESPWSDIKFWETGLLKQEDWKAEWITTGGKDTLDGPSPIFRKAFQLPLGVKKARLYITAHGLYQAQINGKNVSEDYFTPGWTSYHKRLLYQTYDVSSLLKKGGNTFLVTLGDGWFRGHFYGGNKEVYGKDLALLAQMEMELMDGSVIEILSDGTWKYGFGPVRSSSFYNGEVFDARLNVDKWIEPGFDDNVLNAVTVENYAKDHLTATIAPFVRKHEVFHPIRIFKTPAGETVADFGQNFAGFVQIKAKGNSGDQIRLKHAEILDKEGNFYTANLRSAKQEICYILKGGQQEVYEPHFTYQGFRYIKIELEGLSMKDVELKAFALYSDLKTTGKFYTSDEELNKLQHNIVWGQKSNFLEIPIDCPQRDERLGWTGDTHAFLPAGAFNMNIAGFIGKWLKDLKADQRDDGAVPFIVPMSVNSSVDVKGSWYGTSGYSDAATIIPWQMYKAYGDTMFLKDQYASMKSWVDYVQRNCKGYLWNTGFHYGDHTAFDPADKLLVAQSFMIYSIEIFVNSARILGREKDVSVYSALLDSTKAAFIRHYIGKDGLLTSPTQGAYVLALKFNCIPDSLKERAVRLLVDDIKKKGDQLTTGFMATPHINFVLSDNGYADVAYDLLWQKSPPSWLYPLEKGATTIWELWDGVKPNGDVRDPYMNSFNHFANGSIGNWMYQVIGGIRLSEGDAGYKHFVINPVPHKRLKFCNTTLETAYGTIKVYWSTNRDRISLKVTIPPNTSAEIVLPSEQIARDVLKQMGNIKGVKSKAIDNEGANLKLGSGEYHFDFVHSLSR
ncbi:alpha-L-rhamnosidase [Niabella aquatica]